jgi:hypothetical protein
MSDCIYYSASLQPLGNKCTLETHTDLVLMSDCVEPFQPLGNKVYTVKLYGLGSDV